MLQETIDMWNLRVSAFCLIPNHYHLLVQTPDANLSRCIRHIDGVYTQRYNRFHGYDGQLFRGHYKSVLVDERSYLLEVLRYIHRNPLKAGLSETLEGYPWSSHKGYISKAKKWNWLHKRYVLSRFTGNKSLQLKMYRAYVKKEGDLNFDKIIEGKRWPAIHGSKKFAEKLKKMFFPEKIDAEIPQSRIIAPDITEIIKIVSEFVGISTKELMYSRRGELNEPRNIAIYIARRLRQDTLKQIGNHFQITYKTVSSHINKMNALMRQDKALKRTIDK